MGTFCYSVRAVYVISAKEDKIVNRRRHRFVGILIVLFGVSLLFSFHVKHAVAAPQATPASPPSKKAKKTTLPTDWDKNNCDECVKDAHAKEVTVKVKKTLAGENPNSPISFDVSKNLRYVQPPAALGDGHAVSIDLVAPGKILSVDPYPCVTSRVCNYQVLAGTGCGWTHQVELLRDTDNKWVWVGWSNSGENCFMRFTIHYQ